MRDVNNVQAHTLSTATLLASMTLSRRPIPPPELPTVSQFLLTLALTLGHSSSHSASTIC